MKIGIFGGTFDPVHQGHLVLARHAREQLLDKIFFVPTWMTPHKTEESPVASGKQRYEMLELAIQDDDGFFVSDAEIKREGISYTVDTLKIFRRDFPGAEFFLILGADSYQHFSSWKDPEEIESMARFLIAPREGCDLMLDPAKATLIPMKPISISSSDIRARFQRGEAVGENRVSGDVLRYIQEQGLYQNSKSGS